MNSEKDLIVAISTPAGRGGIGIIRASFDDKYSFLVLKSLFGKEEFEPRHAYLLPFYDANGNLLDRVIVLYFAAPNSFTGETVLEIQAHGGPVLLNLILETVLRKCAFLKMRLAEPGEFTKRAFLNGKLDLAQAEAVADLIDASTRSATLAAARSLSGDFSKKIEEVSNKIIETRAFVEAGLDFPEEEIDSLSESKIFKRIQSTIDQLNAINVIAQQGKILRDGVTVALVGSPNVGKSSLLNALSGEEVAIVTEIAGTTRDKIEHWVMLEGVAFNLIDTAGLRTTEDVVEQKGIERTLGAIEKADIVLQLFDASDEISSDEMVLDTVMRHVAPNASLVKVGNKVDNIVESRVYELEKEGVLLISAKYRIGLDKLKKHLLSIVNFQEPSESIFMARERHLTCLNHCLDHLVAAYAMKEQPLMLELLAEELRLASNSLSEILGEFSADDLLGLIFSKFCIGK